MSEYKTQQKEALLSFLYKNRETPLSVDDISVGLSAECPGAPGKSTVYRLINRLYEEGSVKRFEKGSTRTFLYQFAGDEDCHRHLHLKCTGCGKLLHMDKEQSEKIVDEILGGSDFAVNREETTLFGICAECMKNEKTER